MLTHIQLVHVPVADQDRAYEFYVNQLGMSVDTDLQMGPHGRWLQVSPAGAATSIALIPGDADARPGSATVVFESDDIDADAKTMRGNGVDLPDTIEEMPWARVLRFTDPDGNSLAVQTPTTSPG